MQGAVCMSKSNANHKLGKTADNQVFAKHTWTSDKPDQTSTFEMEFENPTSLVSVNMELNFSCDHFQDVASGPQEEAGDTKEGAKSSEPNKQTNVNAVLGMFSIDNNFDFDAPNLKEEAKVETKKETYIPLVIKKFSGSSYKQTLIPSKILFDDDSTYASNYARPELVFAHPENARISLEKFTVRSSLRPQGGAYPIGQGLVFLSDSL